VSSRLAVPRWLRSGSFSLGVDPLQSRHVLPAVRRFTAGAGSHEVFRPYDDVIQASPVLRWSIHLHRGSAPRFSQPLSGFWHTWSSRPCFVPLPSMGFTLQSVPPRRGRCPSRDRQLPCSSPPPYLRCDTPGRILRVSPTPAPSRGGLDPPGAPTPFPPLASQRLPRRLEPCAPCSPVPVTSAASKRFSPHEAVAHGTTVSHRAEARCSPGSCPSRAFLRSSLGPFVDPVDHSVHRGASTANVGEGYSPPSGETATTSRSRRPRRRVRPALRTRIGPCRLSATTLPPTTFRLASELVCPGPRRFEGLDQRPIYERWVALLGFSASSATSRFRASRRPSRRAAPFGAAVSPVS